MNINNRGNGINLNDYSEYRNTFRSGNNFIRVQNNKKFKKIDSNRDNMVSRGEYLIKIARSLGKDIVQMIDIIYDNKASIEKRTQMVNALALDYYGRQGASGKKVIADILIDVAYFAKNIPASKTEEVCTRRLNMNIIDGTGTFGTKGTIIHHADKRLDIYNNVKPGNKSKLVPLCYAAIKALSNVVGEDRIIAKYKMKELLKIIKTKDPNSSKSFVGMPMLDGKVVYFNYGRDDLIQIIEIVLKN